MPREPSDQSWIGQLRTGDPAAAQVLWEQYHARLVRFARKRLRASPRRAADEEDVALSAINSFCLAAARGKFPQLADRDDLWKLLVTITARKALRHVQYERRQKRGGGKIRGESVFRGVETFDDGGIEQCVGSEPTPAFAAELGDELRQLLARLGDETLRRVAVLKMEGYTNAEIAAQLGSALRSIERKLRGIRTIWSAEEGSA